MSAAATWQRLVGAGIVHGEPPAAGEAPLAWYLRALAAVAAWIAAICVLSSTSLLVLHAFDSAVSALFVGAVLLAVGAWVLAAARGRVFVGQFGLAFAIAGEAAIGLGIALATEPRTTLACALIGAFEAVMLVAIADRTHRALAALAIGLCGFVVLARLGPVSLAAPLVTIAFVAASLAATRDAYSDALWRPASAGLGVALLAFAPLADLMHDMAHAWHAPADLSRGVAALLMAIAFVAAVALLCRRLALADRRVVLVALLGAIAIAALAHPVPGLLAALIVMLVAFDTGRPALTGLGIACAIGMLGYYYYSLATTLIAKSVSLATVGIVLVGVGLALRHVARASEAQRHA